MAATSAPGDEGIVMADLGSTVEAAQPVRPQVREIDLDPLMLSYASMEGLPSPDQARAPLPPAVLLSKLMQGLLLVGVLTIAASWIAKTCALPLMLCALLLGVSLNFLYRDDECKLGIDFASRVLLRLGIALLGVRVTAAQIAALGLPPLITVTIGTLSTIALGAAVARLLGLRTKFGILSGSAVGICGASAAMAVSTMLPGWRERERDTVLTVVVVTALSTIAMVTYPLIATILKLSHRETAIFFGGAIHDVAQVVGAGYLMSPDTGDMAVYVKLLRVALLLPICLLFGIASSWRRRGSGEGRLPIPYFLFAFALLVVMNSLGWIPHGAADGMTAISQCFLGMAIVALGAKTSFRALVQTGWKPMLLIVVETLWIGAFILAAIALMR